MLTFCLLIVDDSHEAYVQGAYLTEQEAVRDWRRAMCARFSEDTVEEYEQMEVGLAGLIPYRIDWLSLPVDVAANIPDGLIEMAYRWVDLYEERGRVSDEIDDYNVIRDLEDRQISASIEMAGLLVGWLRDLGKVR